MRSHQQYLDAYAVSHRHPVNQWIHLICVPAIFFASFALAYAVPVGDTWVNLATVGSLPVLAFYARLGARSLLTGLGWLAVSLALCVGIEALGLALAWVAGATFVIAWAAQFVGHKIEGAKPSFIDDLLFLLVGPLFVQHKLNRLIRTGSLAAA
jgi:uncharacterized membrane protein YGL010W